MSTMDSNLLARAAVTSEFRTVDDLIDRIGGGAGFGGVKAVAPTGQERVVLSVPADVNEVSLLGERLDVVRFDFERDTFVGTYQKALSTASRYPSVVNWTRVVSRSQVVHERVGRAEVAATDEQS